MIVNTNAYVVVYLTAAGREVYRQYVEKVASSMPRDVGNRTRRDLYTKLGADDRLRVPLWEFAYIFGSQCLHGSKQVIERNELHIADDDECVRRTP